MSKMNMMSMLMLLISTLFTVSYSVRLIVMVYLSYMNKMNYFILFSESLMMSMSLIILYLYSLMVGYFLVNLMNFTLIILSLFEKLMVMQICLMGCILGWFMSFVNMLNLSNYSKMFFSSMWGLNLIYMKISYYPLKFSMFMYKGFDKDILEYMFIYGMKKSFIVNLFDLLMLNKFMYMNLFM